MFEVGREEESVKVYLHEYNGNVQQNPQCVKSCVTKEFSISLRFSPMIFDPDANSVLLRARLCTAVDSRFGTDVWMENIRYCCYTECQHYEKEQTAHF